MRRLWFAPILLALGGSAWMPVAVGCSDTSAANDETKPTGTGGGSGARGDGSIGTGGSTDSGSSGTSGASSGGTVGHGGNHGGGTAGNGSAGIGAGSGSSGSAGNADAASAVHTVMVGVNDAFSPQSISIRAGDTVHWIWQDDEHSVTSGEPGVADDRFCSPSDTACASAPASDSGFTYDHTFAAAGTFPYFCRKHWSDGMTGTVVVE